MDDNQLAISRKSNVGLVGAYTLRVRALEGSECVLLKFVAASTVADDLYVASLLCKGCCRQHNATEQCKNLLHCSLGFRLKKAAEVEAAFTFRVMCDYTVMISFSLASIRASSCFENFSSSFCACVSPSLASSSGMPSF